MGLFGRRRHAALLFAAVILAAPAAGRAQGVFTPMPGSAPAASGPNAVNPSAAPSDRNPSAYNPSAAPSAISTPNAINPSATPSTFAPQVAPLSGPTVLPRSVLAPRPSVRPRGRAGRAARTRERPAARSAAHPVRRGASVAPPPPQAVRRTDQRARAIMNSVCRGC
jgi:hypothetical protein